MASVAAFDLPCFSITTSSSGLSQGRISIDPSKVPTVTSGVPLTVKRFSSRSVNRPRSAPTMSTQPGPASTTARAATALEIRSPVRTEQYASFMAHASGLLDGRGGRGVSCIDELAADIGLHDRQLGVENDEVGNGADGEKAMADQAKFAGRRGRAYRCRVDQRQAGLPDEHLKRPIHCDDAAGDRPVGANRRRCAGGNRLATQHRGGA